MKVEKKNSKKNIFLIFSETSTVIVINIMSLYSFIGTIITSTYYKLYSYNLRKLALQLPRILPNHHWLSLTPIFRVHIISFGTGLKKTLHVGTVPTGSTSRVSDTDKD